MNRRTILLACFIILAGLCAADVITVNWDGSDDYTTIQAAIDAAADGDEVVVADGTYTEDINIGGKNIVLQSTNPDDWSVVEYTIIQGTGSGCVVTFGGTETVDCKLTGFTITGGYTTGAGGGIQGNACSAVISRCLIMNNTTETAGGGIQNFYGQISHCKLIGNTAGGVGGALAGCQGMISDCLIAGNSASNGNGINNCDGDIINCTITENAGGTDGAVRSCDGAITNCIVWGNTPDAFYNCTSDITYCCYSDAIGEGNIDVDPLFVDAAAGDYHVQVWSPCVDRGTNSPAGGLSDFDLDGNVRLIDGDNDAIATVDMGAYEITAYTEPAIRLSAYEFEFRTEPGGENPVDQLLTICNIGLGVLDWEIIQDCNWLDVSPEAGSSTGETDEVVLSVNITGLERGVYACELNVFGAGAVNSPQVVSLCLKILPEGLGVWVPYEYETIQAAIDAVLDSDIVIVADGIYTGDGNRDIDFLGKAITVKSENGPESCTIDCQGSKSEPHRGFIFQSGEETDSILEGFTILNGYGRDELINDYTRESQGGGIFCYQSMPIIRDCVFTDNRACDGAAISCWYSDAEISNCKFNNGIAENWGGGIYCSASSDTITYCTFIDNSAFEGGAITTIGTGYPAISNCTMTGNVCSGSGGGINIDIGSTSTISNCVISDNFADDYGGGGISIFQSNPVITGCLIYNNISNGSGGGILHWYYFEDGPVITNCTIYGNSSMYKGAGIIVDRAHSNPLKMTVSNSIVWGNSSLGCDFYKEFEAEVIFTNCDLRGSNGSGPDWYPGFGTDGGGNIDKDPLFIDEGGYHLLPQSPCIDAGMNTPVGGLPSPDIDGTVRPIDGNIDGIAIADIGAFEGLPPTESYIVVNQQEYIYCQDESEPTVLTEILEIRNVGPESFNWEILEDCQWLTAEPSGGNCSPGEPNQVELSIDTTGLAAGAYVCELSVSSQQAINSPVTVTIKLYVYDDALVVPYDYSTIQAAIDAATEGNTVLVCPGVYFENIVFGGIDIKVASLDPSDESIVESTVIYGNYDNSFEIVIFWHDEGPDCELAGFTITSHSEGLTGIRIYGSSPTVSNCTIRNLFGRGVEVDEGAPSFISCVIRDNRPYSSGGGMCVFGSAYLKGCLLENNVAGYVGGGIQYFPFYPDDTLMILEECVFVGNMADDYGGSLYLTGNSISISNCLFSSNSADYGGGIYGSADDLKVINCTFSDNTAIEGGGIYNNGSTLTVTNCILWGDTPEEIFNNATVTYSNVEGGWGGEGNIDSDPLFVDAVNGDYHLMWDSPCINAGDLNFIFEEGEVDIDGEPRVMGERVDMGADEVLPYGPYLLAQPNEFKFLALEGGANPENQVLTIRNIGIDILYWNISEKCEWLSAEPLSGVTGAGDIGEVTLSIDTDGLNNGLYTCDLIIDAPGVIDCPQVVDVVLRVTIPDDFLWVPYEYPTIQAAIDVAVDGDTIIVELGTYIENISFNGKNITLASTNPVDWSIVDDTIIHGTGSGSVVTFGGSETAACELVGFTITGGYTTEHGGGIQTMGASPTIERCIIRDNISELAGGAIQNYYGKISQCIVKNNQANTGGAFAGCRGPIENCLVFGNTANYAGAFNNCDGDIANCTVVVNTTIQAGVFRDCDGTIMNCIIWDNVGDVFYDCTAQVNYNCYSGASDDGNIDIDPIFVDAEDGDYHLMWDSPCVDAGDPNFVAEEGEVDIDGEPRVMGARVDMGADEVGEKQADFTRDGRIDISDLAVLSGAWDTAEGEEDWYVLSDLFEDWVIGLDDLVMFVEDWMWHADWY